MHLVSAWARKLLCGTQAIVPRRAETLGASKKKRSRLARDSRRRAHGRPLRRCTMILTDVCTECGGSPTTVGRQADDVHSVEFLARGEKLTQLSVCIWGGLSPNTRTTAQNR